MGIEFNAREQRRKLIEVRPVRGRAPAVDQPCCCQREQAGADRSDTPRPCAQCRQRGDDRAVARRKPRARAAGNQQGVRLQGCVVQGVRGDEGDARRGHDRTCLRGRHHDLVGCGLARNALTGVGHGEYFQRPRDVQHLRLREHGDDDAVRWLHG